MKAAQDFNYRVALADGLKNLERGRLRQAEEQFRYLIKKFPGLDGGYRGLARVLIELEDRRGALEVLRDGASALAKAGARDMAISFLRDAVQLDETDLGTHRRLAAALTLAGDEDGAGREVARFIDVLARSAGHERARAELRYALERLGSVTAVRELADRYGATEHTTPEQDERLAATHGPTWTPPPAPTYDEPLTDEVDAETAEARAIDLLARRDPRAPAAALIAARAHLNDGHANAASDLLLQLIASGAADHDAQRMLVDVVEAIGRRDVAQAKAALLEQVGRLAEAG